MRRPRRKRRPRGTRPEGSHKSPPQATARNAKIIERIRRGATLLDCATAFGISRQRVSQSIRRYGGGLWQQREAKRQQQSTPEYRAARKERRRAKKRTWHQANKERISASKRAYYE